MLYLILASLISVSVTPSVCLSPCNIRVILKVEPAKDNERVVLEVDGPDYYHRSDLDYTKYSVRTIQITYPNVPSGPYTVVATLYKHDGKSWVAGMDTKRVIVK